MSDLLIDPARCPLCGGENGCALAAGRRTCWCFAVEMAADALERVPAHLRGEVCLCRNCAGVDVTTLPTESNTTGTSNGGIRDGAERGSPLHALGWSDGLRRALEALRRSDLEPARVTVEHRGCYGIIHERGTATVDLGNHLRRAANALDRPAVGDWVALAEGRIEAVLPRRSVFVRRSARRRAAPQVVAANVDTVLIVTTADREIEPRLIERYVAASMQGGAKPVVVLNKIDAHAVPEHLQAMVDVLRSGVVVESVSALLKLNEDALLRHIGTGTAALVGLSGAGKTTIANWLLGRDDLATGAVSARDGQGRHTTTHRELYLLPQGGVLIDTPGMRELGLWMTASELTVGFPDVAEFARRCRFGDCRHEREPGCAVRDAIASGALSLDRFRHFQKLHDELASERRLKGR